MRVLVYAAGVYALMGIGVAEAFAPGQTVTGGDKCMGPGCNAGPSTGGRKSQLTRSPSVRMLGAGHVGQQSGVDGPRDGLSGSVVQGQSLYTAAASFEAAYVAPAAQNPAEAADRGAAQGGGAPAKSWTPPAGYVPRRESRPAAESGDQVMSRVSSMMSSLSTDVPEATRAPAEPVQAGNTVQSAPAKSWQPYGGYDPKSRGAPAPAPAASAPYQPAAAPYQPAADSSVPTSPAKKWQPYGGYDPKNRAGAVKPEQVDSLSSAPAKSWQPYGGYDPKGRAAGGASAPAAQAYAPAEAYEAASAAPA
jgi:hypothetical protein